MIRSFRFDMSFSLLILDIGRIFSYLSAKGTWWHITCWCLKWSLHLGVTLAQHKISYGFLISVLPLWVICIFLFVPTRLFLEEMSHEVLFLSWIPSFQFSLCKINNVLLFSKSKFSKFLCNFENFLMFSNGFLGLVLTLLFNLWRVIIWVSIPISGESYLPPRSGSQPWGRWISFIISFHIL